MRSAICIAIVYLALASGAPGALGQSWKREAARSAVYIFFDVTDPFTGAKTTVQGTGTIVSKQGYVLTSAHLFRDWSRQTFKAKEENEINASLGEGPGFASAAPMHLRVIDQGFPGGQDAALLKLPDPGPEMPQGYPAAQVCLATPREAQSGDSFWTYGFPLGINIQRLPGVFGSVKARGGRWEAASPMEEGLAGGPVYDGSGNLLGFVSGGAPNSEAARWITPIRQAKSLLRVAGVGLECPPAGDAIAANVTIVVKTPWTATATTAAAPRLMTPFVTRIENAAIKQVDFRPPRRIAPFETSVETAASALISVVDGGSGNPVAHALIEIVNPKNGKKLVHIHANSRGEFLYRYHAGKLHVTIRDGKHEDASANLYISGREQGKLHIIIPMNGAVVPCAGKK